MNGKHIYALGFFDGVHLGHQALLTACRALAAATGHTAGVVTFLSHPDTLVQGIAPSLINTRADRKRLLCRQFHMDTLVELPFDRALMALPWQAFLALLEERHGAAGFVCGQDFRFGRHGEGTALRLADYCRERELPCTVVPEQALQGITVSSSHIRTLLEQGDVETANAFLGHPHILSGTVTAGKQLGRTIGIPTANLAFPRELAALPHGVYACRAITDTGVFPCVTNIGTRPTVSGQGVTVESWLMEYEGDLYGKPLTLEFYKFLRPEKKFPSLEALRREIQENARQVATFFEKS